MDEKRKKLIQELFKEILERVGEKEKEKEVVMRWWYDIREGLVGGIMYSDGAGGQEESLVLSRL
jgi:hypothetical protein